MSETDRDIKNRGAVAAETLLRRIFDIVSDEAARNPDLMMRLMREIATAGQIEPPKPAPAKKAGARKSAAAKDAAEPEVEDELSNVNPIAILSEQGADALRDHLRFIRKKDPFVRMAKRYALDVPAAVRRKKASLTDTIEAIIAACERRIREQELSGG